jgi:hypothetical protein
VLPNASGLSRRAARRSALKGRGVVGRERPDAGYRHVPGRRRR